MVLIEGNEENTSKIAATGSIADALSIENLRRVFDIDVTTFDDPHTGEVVYNPFSLAKKPDQWGSGLNRFR